MHRGSTIEPRQGRRRPTRLLVVGVVALLLSGVLVSCTTNPPQAVLNVPGNYVADLWATPELLNPTEATVLMCMGETSAVRLETGDGGEGAVGSIVLEWAGTTYATQGTGEPVTLTTPVLQPGCGLLTFGVDCCHVDHYLAIKATKV